MKKLGITGGVGSGKSLVLEYLEEAYHAAVFQADLIAHEVQLPGEKCHEQIVDYFGKEILLVDGRIDRRKLGNVVFSDAEKLLRLNAIVHPAVNRRILELIEDEAAKGTELFILEAALLTEKIYREMLDEIWYIHVGESVRRNRLKRARGYTDEKIDAIFLSQPSEEEFRRFCNREIENGGDFEETKRVLNLKLAEFGIEKEK